MASDYSSAGPRALCWLDCQTGGTTARALAKFTGIGRPAREWPSTAAALRTDVVLACQATPDGTRSAIGWLDQHIRMDGRYRLVGLVCVAAEDVATIPATVAEHLDLIAAAGWRVWRLGWGVAHTDPALIGAMLTPDALAEVIEESRKATAHLGWIQPAAVAA